MALKDWKKVGEYKWLKNNYVEISLLEANAYTPSKWSVYRYRMGDINMKYLKQFNTKSQALKFAKSYMRTH